jgi:hypothetical protein
MPHNIHNKSKTLACIASAKAREAMLLKLGFECPVAARITLTKRNGKVMDVIRALSRATRGPAIKELEKAVVAERHTAAKKLLEESAWVHAFAASGSFLATVGRRPSLITQLVVTPARRLIA